MPGDLRNFYSSIPKSVEAAERSTAAEGASQPPSSEALNTNGSSNNSDCPADSEDSLQDLAEHAQCVCNNVMV